MIQVCCYCFDWNHLIFFKDGGELVNSMNAVESFEKILESFDHQSEVMNLNKYEAERFMETLHQVLFFE